MFLRIIDGLSLAVEVLARGLEFADEKAIFPAAEAVRSLNGRLQDFWAAHCSPAPARVPVSIRHRD